MKFLLDAQLPKKLAHFLNFNKHDTLHTLDLPQKNLTKDSEVNTVSISERRVVVSKYRDFVESIIISKKTNNLLYINTGNITNTQLQELFRKNLDYIVMELEKSRFVELTSVNMVTHNI